ncbi:MAG: DUF998 domain-containing protein [Nitrososphaeria archaeon]
MKYAFYLGILALMIAWTTIIASIILSPWWDIWTGNLSQLGSIEQPYSYVYNMGLTIAGVAFGIYSVSLINITRSRVGALASGIFLIASVHLIGVAIFASQPDLHTFSSGEFFGLTSLTIIFFGIALLSDRYLKHGALSLLLFVIGWGGSIFIDFPSTAFLEIYNIILMSIWIVAITHYSLKKSKSIN